MVFMCVCMSNGNAKIALGQHNDNFVNCPADALTWESRKYLILQEIIQNDPDVICLQVRVLPSFQSNQVQETNKLSQLFY